MKIKREKRHHLRDIYPTKYYSDEGFVETKLEINLQQQPVDRQTSHAKIDVTA